MNSILPFLQTHYSIKHIGQITWSHAVNSQEKLDKYIADSGTMMIESDIRVSSKGELVCAHPPETDSGLSFDSLLVAAFKTQKGIKLDFKDPEVLIPCLEKLASAKPANPTILNADILPAKGANPPNFAPHSFVSLCNKIYPQGILSVGWTTTAEVKGSYTQNDIDTMLQITSKLSQAIYPVRACHLPKSQEYLNQLISRPGHTLCIWNNEPISSLQKNWIQNQTHPEKTYYDLIDEDKNPIRLYNDL